ncbi:GNAT family N-acetyltransferase [Rhodocytophaga rosea]|uniref:GNAT family N-acetyltransferase n=1 Tax=Rhodocytophaga rosea TaxID=2704465 RepID=A0A6C0GIZ5_9BACT|nr:GNAT family protein [Rhodocytophaga rosea]QHT68031.1 GNAT family N-acetyltransferase [Rhodocytophaga rosea]
MHSIFLQPPTLENKRVLLKPLSEEDFEGLIAVGLAPSLWAVSYNKIATKEDLQQYLRTAIQQRETGQAVPFTIIDKQTNKIAGSTRYGNISFDHKRLEIGWTWVGVEFQKTGLNRACKHELLQYAFETLLMQRVELKTDALNTQSREAMRKMGATEEGTLRRHMITEGGRSRDSVYFSIIADEWPKIRQEKFGQYIL